MTATRDYGDVVTIPTTEPATSWYPVSLEPALRGEDLEEPPKMFARSDGACLLYRGGIHWLHGEPESGKSWLALAACVERLRARDAVAYFDFESTAGAVVGRLQALGAADDDIRNRFLYVQPTEVLANGGYRDLDRMLVEEPTLAVIDAATEAMTVLGLDLANNGDVAAFLDALPRRLSKSGTAVLVVDHVTKDRETRGRFALGAGHKLAASTAAYSLEQIRPFGRGLEGLSRLEVVKDRPGFVRQGAANGKRIGELHVRSEGTNVFVEITPVVQTDPFRPTVLMERVSRFLEELAEGQADEATREGLQQDAEQTTNEIVRAVAGRASATRRAIEVLVAEGYVGRRGVGQRLLHWSVRAFREGQG